MPVKKKYIHFIIGSRPKFMLQRQLTRWHVCACENVENKENLNKAKTQEFPFAFLKIRAPFV